MKFGRRNKSPRSPSRTPRKLQKRHRPPPHDDSADINPNGTGSQLLRMGVDLMRSSRQRSATVGSSRYRTPTPHPDRPRRHTAGVSAGEDEGYGGEYRIPPIPNLFEPFENLEDEPPTPPIPPKSPFRPPPVITVPSAWDIPSSSSSQYSRGRPSFSSSYPPRPTTHYLDNPGFRDHPNRRFAFVESSPRHRDSLIATIDGAETNYDGEDEYEYDTCRQNDHSRKNMRSRRAASNVPRSRDQPPPVQQPPSQPLPRSNQRARNRPRGEQNLHTPASSDGVCKEQRSRGRQRVRSCEVSPLRLPRRDSSRKPAQSRPAKSDHRKAPTPAVPILAVASSQPVLAPTPIHPPPAKARVAGLMDAGIGESTPTPPLEVPASLGLRRGRPRGRSVRKIVDKLEGRSDGVGSVDDNFPKWI